jgi:hypothetical protein
MISREPVSPERLQSLQAVENVSRGDWRRMLLPPVRPGDGAMTE